MPLHAQQTVLRDDAVFHDQLAGGGTTDAHLVLGLADVEAGIGALHDEGADLLLLAAALVGDKTGDGDDDEHIGKAGVGDEDLGAVQLPVVALVSTAKVCWPWASVPAPGSVRPKAPIHSPLHSLGRYFSFWAGVPFS